jgi:hypothetical protein
MRQRWMRQLGRVIPIWAAAWIDTRPELDAAYQATLRVSDAEHRGRLLFLLSDLPIRYEDVTDPIPLGGAAESADPRLQAARSRMGWSQRFRQHYADVLAQVEEIR